MKLPSKIHKADLVALTGLDEERLRQLAIEGHFPRAVKGEYPTEATLKGLFTYYREHYQFARANKAELEQEKLRKDIELRELSIQEKKNQLVPAAEVERVWGNVCRNVAQVVTAADIPRNVKEELTAQMREIPVSEFSKGENEDENN